MPVDQHLLLSIEDTIAYITINRPDAHNALSRTMWQRLPELFSRAKAEAARVVVLTGSGSSFASGADLAELERIDGYPAAQEIWYSIKHCLDFVWSFELPTIAMVNGACLGGGCLLALACDLRIAGSQASFGIPVARLGLVLDDLNIERLVGLVGPAAARELLYLGDTISSGRAEMIGLVNQAVEQGTLLELVKLHAQHIAGNSSLTISAAKRSINRAAIPTGNTADNEEAVLQSYLSEDFRCRISRIRP